MRAIIVTALSLAAAAPAMAGSFGINYLGLRGSYVDAEDQSTTSLNIDDNRTFSEGWGVSGFAGFVIDDALRGEIEAGYRINDIDRVRVVRNVLDVTTEGDEFAADGQVDMGLAMANLYYDFQIKGIPVLPWVGVGIGGAYVNYSIMYDYGDPVAPVLAKDSDWQFAYQLMAGVTVPIAEATSVSLAYRYFKTEDMTFVDAYGLEFGSELTNQSLDIGLQFHL